MMLKQILLFIVLISVAYGYELTHFSSSSETICMHSRENEETPVECQVGESCYAIASAHFNNGTWGLRKYALGCWETTPDCTEGECVMSTPNYVWVDHHFPRFCCCKGNYCNKNIRLEK